MDLGLLLTQKTKNAHENIGVWSEPYQPPRWFDTREVLMKHIVTTEEKDGKQSKMLIFGGGNPLLGKQQKQRKTKSFDGRRRSFTKNE